MLHISNRNVCLIVQLTIRFLCYTTFILLIAHDDILCPIEIELNTAIYSNCVFVYIVDRGDRQWVCYMISNMNTQNKS